MTKMNLLIIDDDPNSIKRLFDAVEKGNNINSEYVEYLRPATKKIQEKKIDFILLDAKLHSWVTPDEVKNAVKEQEGFGVEFLARIEYIDRTGILLLPWLLKEYKETPVVIVMSHLDVPPDIIDVIYEQWPKGKIVFESKNKLCEKVDALVKHFSNKSLKIKNKEIQY